jgi:hypothetical protein
LVDEEEAGADVTKKYFQRPLAMQAFGRNVTQVWVKDWLQKRSGVEKQLLSLQALQ